MTRICKQCRRANPPEAAYCYHDGVALEIRPGGGSASNQAINIGILPFTVPFVLPSGQSCRNFNELAQTCQQNPASALVALRKGYLEAFFAGQGRSDLAGAAHAAARAAVPDRGLDELIGRLPASCLRPPLLRVEQPILDLGTVRLGEDHSCEIVLHNDGTRLLYGSASCAGESWLSLGEGQLLQRKLFQFYDRTTLPLHILGRRLRAYRKPQEAKIQLESNGGTITVVVRIQVAVQPFTEGVLAGALSPRQLAEKARDAPKQAVPLIESGAVARWYQANGWSYPVTGPTASGLAAVQQLFEALGFAKPPPVELSEDQVVLTGFPGQKVEHVLAVVTMENRAALAHGTSDQPWLQVGPTVFHGRTATLPLLIPSVSGRNGETLTASLAVTANGNQRFVVPVTLTVADPPGNAWASAPPLPSPKKSAPVLATQSPPAPKDKRTKRPMLLTLLPAVLLALLLVGVTLRDFLVPAPMAQSPDNKVLDSVPRLAIRFHDVKQNDELEKLWLSDPQPTMRFGLVMLNQGREVGKGVSVRRLTFDPQGRTNNTCLRFDGKDERLFGSATGRWEESAAKTWKDDKGQKHQGTRSVWICDDKRSR